MKQKRGSTTEKCRQIRCRAWEKAGNNGSVGYQEITIPSARGTVRARWYASLRNRAAVIWVGGVGGGWDTPAKNLYPHLADRLQREGISSLRIRFRDSMNLEEAVHDATAGIDFLEQHKVERLGFVGHSFGGAVVIEAATTTTMARAVVTLATQAYGADRIAELNRDCSVLLIHGTRDRVLAPANSQYLHELAHDPKQLILVTAHHVLAEVAEEVERVVHDWLVTCLNG